MKIKICTPVIGKTLKEFLNNLDQVQEISDMVELRVDEIKNLTGKDLRLIKGKTKKEAILTSRKKEIILKAFEIGFDYVDIDLEILEKEPTFAKAIVGKKTKIILSFHNFIKTPEIKELTFIVNCMRDLKVEVIKIATMINNDQDIKNLFKILLSKKKDEKMIMVGMGEKGQITRILGPLLGSFLTFASTEYGESAPGQIDINEMKRNYKLLDTNH
ncbi:MAG: type I 3-dehydroquinate dehydratase [Patescibacteria group bacterium]